MDILKIQDSANVSQGKLIEETVTEVNDTTIEISKEHAEKDENLELNNIEKKSIDAENDPNLPNKNSISQKEENDLWESLKENIDSLPNSELQSDKIESDDEAENLLNTPSIRRKSKKLTLFHSDSENESEDVNPIETENSHSNSDNETVESETNQPRKLKRIAIIDSDSEDDAEKNTNQDSAEKEEYTSVDQNDMKEESRKKNLYSLCDSESSDENNEVDEDREEGAISEGAISETELEALQSNEVISKSRKGKQKEEKEEKMTAKKALEQRKEILAESQRRVRESRVSLPYHKPKCRSLKEFLQNRPKLAAPLGAVSPGQSPSLPIKMSMEQLKVFTQKIKEREKEVEKFYKSESESEPEEEITTEEITNEETKTTNEDSSSAENKVEETDDSLKIEVKTTENDSVEMLDLVHKDKNIGENTEATGIIDKEISENSEEVEKIEKCEGSEKEDKTVIDSDEMKNVEESEETPIPCENNSEPLAEDENNVESSNTELESTKNSQENEEQFEIENKSKTETENTKNIVLISNILVKPTESEESKNIYNLDNELMELASEVEKDDSYEFNLDGIEDESDEESDKREKRKKTKMTSEELKKIKLEILEKVSIVTPRLSVGPNEVIDLENGVAMPDEISKLKEKFLRHNMKMEKHSHKNEVSIMSVSDGQIHKETVAFKMDDSDEDTKPLEKPGVRMQKLREELQHKMSIRRSDLWREKLTKKNKNEDDKDEEDDQNEEKSECDAKDILDNEDEEEFTDPEEDEELEENDCDMSDKKKKKSAYLDEEAEESETEENEIDGNEENEIDENEEEALLNQDEDDGVMDEEDEEADVEDNEETVDDEPEVPKKKVLKRIIKAFEEDSDDETETNKMNHMYETLCKNTSIDKDCASENLLSSLEAPNFKIREPIISSEKSEDHFATPVTYMTGLKNLNTSGSRFVPPESILDEENTQKSEVGHATQECNTVEKSQGDSQNLNVDQNNGITDSLSTQDVLAICTAEFPSTLKTVSSPEISTQQLREVFIGSMKSSLDFNTQDVDDICSGDFSGVSQTYRPQEKEVALDDKDEHLISQLIDEDELENFKKKFESPGVSSSNVNIGNGKSVEEVEEVVSTGGVIDSDEEDEGLKLKDRKRKRLAFSDDEESSTSENVQEEAIDLHDNDDDGLPDNVEYDSEENEIEGTENNELAEEHAKKKFKASDFFEEEAELSESEWGSADEDERNLDDLEFEKGDEENFDEDRLRTDIEKLQMKQMLDEDNREVKMLQELLLEDGELHGSGRQRQFRWKNIDAADNNDDEKKEEDDDVYLEEDESEEKWRKERHEREMLKLKKQSQDEDDSLIIESQNLTFTHKSLKIKSQTTFSPQVTSNDVDSSPKKVKQPFALLNKRGSFLSRGEKVLQKIAETSKVSFTNKNINRVVFQTIDEDTKKRKASAANLGNSTPVALKKLRLSGLSPGLNKNKPKSGKSLFEKILE